MQFTMHQSDAFKKQKKSCDAYLALNDPLTPAGVETSVYLIYRVQGNDTTLSTMFSQKYIAEQHTGFGGIDAAVRGNSGTQVGKGKVKYEAITKKAKFQGGGHAEEMFIRSFDKITQDLAQNGSFTVTRVELFVSKIPCCKRDKIGSSAFELNGVIYPEGCGVKLNKFIKSKPDIEWAICYEKDYAGTDLDGETRNQMIILDHEANAKVYRYLPTGLVQHIALN